MLPEVLESVRLHLAALRILAVALCIRTMNMLEADLATFLKSENRAMTQNLFFGLDGTDEAQGSWEHWQCTKVIWVFVSCRGCVKRRKSQVLLWALTLAK